MSNQNDVIVKLSSQFYIDYNEKEFPEILRKEDRPYEVAVFSILPDIYVTIPFRSHIRHKYSWLFTSSKRSRKSRSGIDFTKMALLQTDKYFERNFYIDEDEYTEFIKHINEIYHEALQYIQTYIKHMIGVERLHERVYQRMYGYSTLPYFHKELKLILTNTDIYRVYRLENQRLYTCY